MRHCNAAGGCSSVALNITFTLPVRVQVDSENPFTGQSVALTVSPPSSQGSVSTYQWQERSNGQWTNLGIASTSAQYTVQLSSAGVRVFRVVITYTSGATENSSWVAVEWRPITVTVAASPEYPESGDATKRVVTLTATADAPSGATYQWQQGSGTSWTNLGTSTTSASKTVSFTTRGTRKFRVQVSHSSASSATSEATYVTWDEWDIVSDLMTDLHTEVTGDSTYTAAQTALLSCMNASSGGAGGAIGPPNATSTPPLPTGASGASSTATPYTSFDQILAVYTDDVKAKMESGGDCHTQATAMFDLIQSLSPTKLAVIKIKPENTVYASLLDTPNGQHFAESVGKASVLKLLAGVMADPPEPNDSGEGGAVGANEPSTGLDCFPYSGRTPDSVQGKLDVLNCLVFATPYQFWVDNADDVKDRIERGWIRQDNMTMPPQSWLGFGDWECTWWFDGPVPSCKKHDVAYSSLQKFAGDRGEDGTGAENEDELDDAWNPRNKSLADSKFFADIMKYGCQQQSIFATAQCLAPRSELANTYHYGTAILNSKGWPVTEQDLDHAGGARDEIDTDSPDYSFINCAGPVPKVTNIVVTQTLGEGYTISWNNEAGCIEGITLRKMRMCLTVYFGGPFANTKCEYDIAGTATSVEIRMGRAWNGTTGLSASVKSYLFPEQVNYGGNAYTESHDNIPVNR